MRQQLRREHLQQQDGHFLRELIMNLVNFSGFLSMKLVSICYVLHGTWQLCSSPILTWPFPQEQRQFSLNGVHGFWILKERAKTAWLHWDFTRNWTTLKTSSSLQSSENWSVCFIVLHPWHTTRRFDKLSMVLQNVFLHII